MTPTSVYARIDLLAVMVVYICVQPVGYSYRYSNASPLVCARTHTRTHTHEVTLAAMHVFIVHVGYYIHALVSWQLVW